MGKPPRERHVNISAVSSMSQYVAWPLIVVTVWMAVGPFIWFPIKWVFGGWQSDPVGFAWRNNTQMVCLLPWFLLLGSLEQAKKAITWPARYRQCRLEREIFSYDRRASEGKPQYVAWTKRQDHFNWILCQLAQAAQDAFADQEDARDAVKSDPRNPALKHRLGYRDSAAKRSKKAFWLAHAVTTKAGLKVEAEIADYAIAPSRGGTLKGSLSR